MRDLPKGAEMNCEEFMEAMEGLPVEAPGAKTAAEWSALLPEDAREHSRECASCEAALEDFAETREALGELKMGLPEPGPWFTARVMGAIRAQEREIEEQRNSVWIYVRRLAPRLAAFAALLLVLGGTWALELRRAEDTRRQEMRPVEGLFESAPSAPLNDDIIASTYRGHRP